jgi:YVTN family beta-propeller protein
MRLLPVPDEVLRVCHRVQAKGSFPVLCPTRLPRASVGSPGQPPNALTALPIGERSRIEGVEFAYGAPYENQQWKNIPTRFLHLAVLDGTSALAGPEGSWERLGQTTLGGRRGELYQAPPYPEGGYHGNHLIFIWLEGHQRYAVSLHSWGSREALGLLGAIVSGLRPASALRNPPAPAPAVSLERVGREASDLAIGEGSVWVARYLLRGRVVRLDWDTGAVNRNPIPVGRYPYRGIAVDGDSVWVANTDGDSLSRIDSLTGRVVTRRIPVGESPWAIGVGERYVWVANNEDGTLSRVDPVTGREVMPRLPVGGGPNGLALADGSVWVTDFEGGEVVRLNEDTGEIIARISAGSGLSDVGATDSAVWVTDFAADQLLRIDPMTNRIVARTPVGPAPSSLAVAAGSVWVSDYWDGMVRQIDQETGQERDRVLVGGNLRQLAAEGSRVWVLDSSGSVAKIPGPSDG